MNEMHFYDELTKDDILYGLLGHGLFTDKIPAFITSESFFEYWESISESNKKIDNKGRDYIRYLSMRNINIPRELAIPHPFVYAHKCKVINENWLNIKTHLNEKIKEQTFKVSRIHIRKQKNTPTIFKMNYRNYLVDIDPEPSLVIGKKYVALADISNCFPSIYNHSISWAVLGKEEAKNTKTEKTWLNELEKACRNVKYQETNGLLIGPHASNLIAEMILVSIDAELVKKYKYVYIRNIDDYKCYANSYEAAEKFLRDLSVELKKYDLMLNHKKSKIIKLPLVDGESWVRNLNNFNFMNTYKFNGKIGVKLNELKLFLDHAIELMLKESNTAIINYAIKKLSKNYLGDKAKKYFIQKIHHLALLYPYLAQFLEEDVFSAHKGSKQIGAKIRAKQKIL